MKYVLMCVLVGSFSLHSVSPVQALDTSNPCLRAIQKYSLSEKVPFNVLYGISSIESNFHPWALNVKGKSWYGRNRKDTVRIVSVLIKKGYRSFDVGCMQMNVKWHHHRFQSVAHLIDPGHNVYQASRFLKELYSEFGNWPKAVSAYHSRTPSRGQAYLKSVASRLVRKGAK